MKTERMVRLVINGEARELGEAANVAALVAVLGLDARKVAVERNLEIVPRSTYAVVPICDGDRIESHSFWADDKEQEETIFNQFLGVVSRFEAPRIYCYGSYEKAFIVRMRQHVTHKKHLDAVLTEMTNILAIIYQHFYFPTYSNGLKEVGRSLGANGAIRKHRAFRASLGGFVGK